MLKSEVLLAFAQIFAELQRRSYKDPEIIRAHTEMSNRLTVSVSFLSSVGYVTEASPELPRSLSALSLEVLRRRVRVAAALRRPDQPIEVKLELDRAARAERDRRRAMAAAGGVSERV